MPNQVVCPYCNQELAEKPQRKKKCPYCSNFFYVRRGSLYTEQGALEEDRIVRWVGSMQLRGLERSEFDRRAQELRTYFNEARERLSQQFGSYASVNDTIWFILNELVMTEHNIDRLANLYLHMAEIASVEGKDPMPYVAEARKYQAQRNTSDLLMWLDSVKYVRIYTTNDDLVCKNCRKLDNKRFRIEDALLNMPIPHKCISPTGCHCYFIVG